MMFLFYRQKKKKKAPINPDSDKHGNPRLDNQIVDK